MSKIAPYCSRSISATASQSLRRCGSKVPTVSPRTSACQQNTSAVPIVPRSCLRPHQGTTPADIQVTIDPGSLGPVQGTNTIVVQIDTNAVNVPLETTVVSNVRDVDQKGSFVQSDGHLIGAVADPSRDRFYVLDRNGFQVKAYDSKSLRQIGSFRTGNTPTWMAASKDGRFLVVANSRAEHVTLIDLNSLRVMGNVFVPWQLLQGGHYPHSVTAANSEMVLGVNTAGGGWRLDFLTLPNRAISSPETLGVFANSFGSPLAVAAHPDGNEVFVADSSGGTYLFEFATRRLIITRSDFSGVGRRNRSGQGLLHGRQLCTEPIVGSSGRVSR